MSKSWSRGRMESLERRQLLAGDPLIIGGKSFDAAYHVATDSNGDRIVAGIFSVTVDFDPTSGVTALTANGETDLYIAKYSADDKLVWVRQYGGGAGEIQEDQLYDTSQATVGEFENAAGPSYEGIGEFVNTLVVGADNSIFFGGSFQGTADFNPLSSTSGNVRSGGYQDGFICKLDSNGNTLWYSTISGPFNNVVKSLALDSSGDVAVTGYFTRTADFNPGKKKLTINAIGRDDIFVQKLFGSNGGLDWAVTAGGESVNLENRDSGEGIAIDSNNNILVTGSFADKVDFAPGPGKLVIKSQGDTDGFLWQLSPKGKMARIQTFGGDRRDSGNRIVFDAEDNAYVAGYFSRTADLDPAKAVRNFEAAEDKDYDGVETDIFAFKQDTNGASPIWITQFACDGFEYLGDITLLSSSALAVTGGWSGSLVVGSAAPIVSVEGVDNFEDHNSRDYSYDGFYATLSAGKGKVDDLQSYGSTSDDYILGVMPASVITGRFKGTVNFGTSADPVNRKSNGQDDGFLLDLI